MIPRDEIQRHYLMPEAELVARLSDETGLDNASRRSISQDAENLVRKVRGTGDVGIMERFLAEYGLSTNEGVALMCLAEAMLRVPDTLTVDELIRDKITPHDWASHLGDSGSILVNASTWGLMLTGRVLDEDGPGVVGTLHAMVRRLGEPVIRRAVAQAMAEMGSQFVLGRTIDEAIKRGETMVHRGYTYSYDMLGEAARTEADALRYLAAYSKAIAVTSARAKSGDVRENPGISVKLSALHPRYERAQAKTTQPVLAGRLLELARAAAEAGIGLNIDAEEADRLDLSLDIIKDVLADNDLHGWDGFGVVVQAFGRRAIPVLDWLYALAGRLDRRIMVRLVKGAYWDMEIKRAQVMGLRDFPVFTRKSHTDVSYLAGARRLLGMTDRIYPQFATHNAHSVAAVLHMAADRRQSFEFQRLHGMGEPLHEAIRQAEGTRCRIYAPVGAHEDLLAYLVRRLLENGANSSFVNQIVDLDVPAEEIARDPIAEAVAGEFAPNPAILRAADLFSPRRNSAGWDLTDPMDLAEIDAGRTPYAVPHRWTAAPLSRAFSGEGAQREIANPAHPDEIVGTVVESDAGLVAGAVQIAVDAQPDWEAAGPGKRAAILRQVADLYEKNSFEILALTAREAGKTLLDGVAEIREAVDFLRYYADQAESTGCPGEARGVIVCISPWNFPLAIFTGQIAAALAAGNAVIAKPAEQTPLIAHRAVQWMIEAGVPADVLHLLPGDGATVGAALTADPRIGGVCFTGSTEVAKLIDRQLAATTPQAMLIAETGGLNAMVVDSTALIEQATRDIVRSAFQSAGQRCSALRVLYVQKDVAPKLMAMLSGAMDALVVGDPWALEADVGPVIDSDAYAQIAHYLRAREAAGQVVKEISTPDHGLFVPPAIVSISGIAEVEKEIFGPILHIATFAGDQIDQVVHDINARGYGLTFGLHSRIDRRVQRVLDQIHVGNAYVNRDQIGAIVGSQPFGGHGFSGTGPKAGGPHYLPRFRKERTAADVERPVGPRISAAGLNRQLPAAEVVAKWRARPDRSAWIRAALRGKAARATAVAAALDYGPVDLPGPTGESNQYDLLPRGMVLCLGPEPEVLLCQVVQALVAGNAVVGLAPASSTLLKPLLHSDVPLSAIDGVLDPAPLLEASIDLVALSGSRDYLAEVRQALAMRSGPIVPLVTGVLAPDAYCHERTICIDTTAAGGNATLLSEAED